MKRFIALLLVLCLMPCAALSEPLRILAIGNSFTRNALRFFYPMAKSVGIGDIIIANMHIDGCSIKKHYNQIRRDRRSYRLYYQDSSGEVETKAVRMSDVIGIEKWDRVVIQQSGGHAGAPSYYKPYLDKLIKYLRTNAPSPDFKLVWYGVWAYARKCAHSSYARYGYNQKRMYNAIVSTENKLIYSNDTFSYIIPSGRAIQMIRETPIGDNLNIKDGFHLNPVGCYAVALCWMYTLFGVSPDEISYQPVDISPVNVALIKQCVARAVNEYARRP